MEKAKQLGAYAYPHPFLAVLISVMVFVIDVLLDIALINQLNKSNTAGAHNYADILTYSTIFAIIVHLCQHWLANFDSSASCDPKRSDPSSDMIEGGYPTKAEILVVPFLCSYFLEDTTTIFLFASLPELNDRSNYLTMANLYLTIAISVCAGLTATVAFFADMAKSLAAGKWSSILAGPVVLVFFVLLIGANTYFAVLVATDGAACRMASSRNIVDECLVFNTTTNTTMVDANNAVDRLQLQLAYYASFALGGGRDAYLDDESHRGVLWTRKAAAPVSHPQGD